MAAAGRMSTFFTLLCLAVYFSQAYGVVLTRPDDFDLQVLTVSRQVSSDRMQMTVNVEFTATREPEARWSHSGYNDESVIVPGTVEYERGRGGRVSVTLRHTRLLTLKLGYFDTHYFKFSIYLDTNNANATQTLNTQRTTISSGHDITYTPGESFEVRATVPRHVADGFSWTRSVWSASDPGINSVRLEGVYVNPSTGRVVSSVDKLDTPDMGRFLNVRRTFNADNEVLQASFNTQGDNINGYFRIFVLSSLDNVVEGSKFVANIRETVNVFVHNATTIPGPFPAGYRDVRTNEVFNPLACARDDRDCVIFCYGYSNDIVTAKIFKEENGGALSEQPTRTSALNRNHVVFSTALNNRGGDFAGNYVCKIESRDGTIGSTTVQVIEGS